MGMDWFVGNEMHLESSPHQRRPRGRRIACDPRTPSQLTQATPWLHNWRRRAGTTAQRRIEILEHQIAWRNPWAELAQDHPPVMEDLWRIYGGLIVDLWRIYGGFTEDLSLSRINKVAFPENLTDITDHVVLSRVRGQGTAALCHYAALWRGKKQRRSIRLSPHFPVIMLQ